MKKTMFITSVIMVVVMAIALTTSSLAWFTAAGAGTVSTNNFQIKAESTAVQGIAISKTGNSNWASSIALTKSGSTEGAAENMQPTVPFSKNGSLTNSATATNNDAVLLEALLGGTEAAYVSGTNENIGTASADTARTAYFVSNKLANNGLFAANTNVNRGGFYEDVFWITNTGSGDGALSTQVKCAISFKYNNGTSVVDYTSSRATYGTDANLCVAVLAQTTQNASNEASIAASEWELLAFNRSQGSGVAVGLGAAAFTEGATAADSCVALTLSSDLSDGSKASTCKIRPQRTNDSTGAAIAADVMKVRVIAWYEGATLSSTNAQNADLMFSLTFTKQDYDPSTATSNP